MSNIGRHYDGLRYSDSLAPGAIYTHDQNWHEPTTEEQQLGKRRLLSLVEVAGSGVFLCGLPWVALILGTAALIENGVRYTKLNKINSI